MQRILSGLILGCALLMVACSPIIPPQETPRVLKDAVSDGYFAYDAGELCSGLEVDEEAYEDRLEDILAQMIEAGYSSDQFVAMLEGLDLYEDWAFPYLIAFERKHEIDVRDTAVYCRALASERTDRTSIGQLIK